MDSVPASPPHRGAAGRTAVTTPVSAVRQRPPAQLVAIVLAALVVSFAAHAAVLIAIDSPVDFYVYYMAGDILDDDPGPYEVTDRQWDGVAERLGVEKYTSPYRYPPYTAAVGRALGPLGPRAAGAVWVAANAAGFIAGAWLLGSALGGGRRLALSLTLMLIWAPAYHTLMDGQVSGLVFFFLALGVWGLLRGNEAVAGAATALAAALKLTPLALVALLAWRRRWRAALWALSGLAAVTLLSLPLAPWREFATYATHAYELTDPQRINVSPQNQSFTGVAGRLLLDTTTWEPGGRAATVRGLALVFAVVLVAVTAFVLRPRGTRGQRRRELDALGYGMVIAGSLVVGTFTYFHQFSWLFIPLLLVCDVLIASRRWRSFALLAVLAVAAGINEAAWLVFREGLDGAFVWRLMDVPFVLALTLWAMCGWLILRDGDPRPRRRDGGGSTSRLSGVGSRESGNRVP